MSARRKGTLAKQQKPGAKSRPRKARKDSRGTLQAIDRDSVDYKLQELRENWELTSALVNVVHAALEGAGAEVVESATPVLFRFGLECMWQDIERLDEVIAQNKKERAS